MDEKIIYIIFVIAWGLYSFYRKSQKKKSQQTAVNSQQSTNNDKEKSPSYKNILEKMLLGEEFTEQPKRMENGEWRMENGEDKTLEVLTTPINPVSEIPIENKITEPVISNQTETSIVLKTFEDYKTKKFDLRQAIIYNVLLERKFDKSNITGF